MSVLRVAGGIYIFSRPITASGIPRPGSLQSTLLPCRGEIGLPRGPSTNTESRKRARSSRVLRERRIPACAAGRAGGHAQALKDSRGEAWAGALALTVQVAIMPTSRRLQG